MTEAAKKEQGQGSSNGASRLIPVVHSRHAKTAQAAARVVERFAQLPSYGSLQPEWRTKKIQPARPAAIGAVEPMLQPAELPQMKPLAWLSEVEESCAENFSKFNQETNHAAGYKSAGEAGVQMNADLIERSEFMDQQTQAKADPLLSAKLWASRAVAPSGNGRVKGSAHTASIQLNIFEVEPEALPLDSGACAAQAATPAVGAPSMIIVDEPACEAMDLHAPDNANQSMPTIEEMDEPLDGSFQHGMQIEEPVAYKLAGDSIQVFEAQYAQSAVEIHEPQPAAEFEGAPLERRTLAAALDLSLILLSFAAFALAAAHYVPNLLGAQTSISRLLLAFLAVTIAYQGFFTLLMRETPGARFAQLRMCTFGKARPTEAQLALRLLLLPLSILPAGLGLLWALVDGQHLCWHDRLSGTCLRYQY